MGPVSLEPPADTRAESANERRSDVPPLTHPELAPGVKLVGEFAGSAFTDRQWLIERSGHFLLVPELLYRVAEAATSERTLDEIASQVSASTDWSLTGEQVGRIITTKLIPLALIAPAPDDAAGPAAAGQSPPSPLQLRLKKRILSAKLIEPVTSVLRFLFLPVILVPLLIAAGFAQVLVFFHHGLAAAIRDVIYTPGAMVAVAILLIAAMVFHEFGHASALHYGNGRARSIGVGLYLIYPSFYTDTTDSYRLSRWARVRTDLGGFYFQLIFALGMIELSLATGQEWLLVTVALIDGLIVRGLIPFVRFDGYWALSDLLGIPDMLTHMKSTITRGWRRRSLRTGLKPWARPLFIVYALVTTPILTLLLALLILRFPLIVSALWTALAVAQEKVGEAWAQNRQLSGVAAGFQLAVLALQTAALAYILGSVATRTGRRLWTWGRPSRARRLGSLLIGAAVVAALTTYWGLTLDFTTGGVPSGVQTYQVTLRTHVLGSVSYPQSPPVGGPHSPVWQNCGFYSTPIANENGVHSMEHGAVWITYRPDLPSGEVAALRVLAIRQSYVLVSPYPGLPAPVVASAWGRQLRLASAGDPRLDRFARDFRLGSQAPERGGPCAGGLGAPQP